MCFCFQELHALGLHHPLVYHVLNVMQADMQAYYKGFGFQRLGLGTEGSIALGGRVEIKVGVCVDIFIGGGACVCRDLLSPGGRDSEYLAETSELESV